MRNHNNSEDMKYPTLRRRQQRPTGPTSVAPTLESARESVEHGALSDRLDRTAVRGVSLCAPKQMAAPEDGVADSADQMRIAQGAQELQDMTEEQAKWK